MCIEFTLMLLLLNKKQTFTKFKKQVYNKQIIRFKLFFKY